MENTEAREDLQAGGPTVPASRTATGSARSVLPYLLILAAAGVLFAPFFLQGRVFLPADNLYRWAPWSRYRTADFRAHNMLLTDPVTHNYAEIYNRQLHRGQLKNWNPYILTGLPATGATAMSGMSGRYHPLKLLLHRLLPTPAALTLLLFVHVALMGLSMHVFLREVGAGRGGALFGALAYMFNGCAMSWLECETQVFVSALFPLVFFCMERYLGPRRYLFALLGALVLGLLWLMGHLQYLLYALLLMLFYLAFLMVRVVRRGGPRKELLHIGACFAVTCVGGTLLGAIEILPVAELLSNSHRIHRTFAFDELFAKEGRTPLRYLVTLIFPDYFGSPILNQQLVPSDMPQDNYTELALYVGIPTVFSFFAAVLGAKRPQARFFALLTVLFALMMAGTFVYRPFFHLFPGMDRMHPTRLAWLFTFSATAAAAFGFEAVPTLPGVRRKIYLGLIVLLTTTVVILAFFSTDPRVIRLMNPELADAARLSRALPTVLHLRAGTSSTILRPLLLCLASALLFSALAYAKEEKYRVPLLGGIVGLLTLELIGAASTFNTVVEPQQVYVRTPAIQYLLEQPRPFRVVMDGSGTHANTLAVFGLEELGGYSSFYQDNVHKFMSFSARFAFPSGSTPTFGRFVGFESVPGHLFDLANVKYFLTRPAAAQRRVDPKLKLVFLNDMAIYENTRALPRAFGVHRFSVAPDVSSALARMGKSDWSPRDEVVLTREPEPPLGEFGNGPPPSPPVVEIRSHEEDEVQLSARFSADGWVVLTDNFYPGWKAYLDGAEVPVLQADAVFRAVAVPAGTHEILFSYRPRSFLLGKILTALAAAALLSGIVWISLARPGLPRNTM